MHLGIVKPCNYGINDRKMDWYRILKIHAKSLLSISSCSRSLYGTLVAESACADDSAGGVSIRASVDYMCVRL